MMVAVAAVVGVFLLAAVGVAAIERRALRLGLMDQPNSRSSHVAARPRGGGVAIVVAVAAGVAVTAGAIVEFDGAMWAILGGALIVAVAGLWDDVRSIGPGPRLAAQVVAASIVVAVAGGMTHLPLPAPLDAPLGMFGVVVALVWMVAVTNFYNFMDGADGLAGGQACLTFATLAVVLWPDSSAIVPVLVIAATSAFLRRNWAPAHLFLGDSGSGWLGFVLAAWAFAGPIGRRGDLVLLVATSMALFLLDPVVTLVRRWRHGARLTSPHREHAYQRLFAPGQSHAGVVSLLLAAGGLLSVVAVWAYWRPAWAWASLGCALCLFLGEWLVAQRISRQRPGWPSSGPASGHSQPGAGV